MVYSFYDPEYHSQSLGKFMILDHINLAKENKFEYLYLGYWIKENSKMGYKANYLPSEVYYKNKWTELTSKNITDFDLNSGQKLPSMNKTDSDLESIIQLPRFSTDPE